MGQEVARRHWELRKDHQAAGGVPGGTAGQEPCKSKRPRPGQPREEGAGRSQDVAEAGRGDLVRAGAGRLGATLGSSLGVVQRVAGLGEWAGSGEASRESPFCGSRQLAEAQAGVRALGWGAWARHTQEGTDPAKEGHSQGCPGMVRRWMEGDTHLYLKARLQQEGHPDTQT